MCFRCEDDDREDEYYRDVVRPLIEQHGWALEYVVPDRGRASLAYTVGLTLQGRPELVVTGRDQPDASAMLDEMGRLWLAAGTHPAAGTQLEPHLGALLEVVDLPHPEAHLLTAFAAYGPALRAQQLVWADLSGRWPWEPPCCRDCPPQPVLGPRAPRPARRRA